MMQFVSDQRHMMLGNGNLHWLINQQLVFIYLSKYLGIYLRTKVRGRVHGVSTYLHVSRYFDGE